MVTFRVLIMSALLCTPFSMAAAQEVSSASPLPPNWEQGIEGNGHELWHDIYKTLFNQNGTHCCDESHCRPTAAKYSNGEWYAMVNGVWMLMAASRRVRDYKYSWSETPHVCASGTTIYCFVPPQPQG